MSAARVGHQRGFWPVAAGALVALAVLLAACQDLGPAQVTPTSNPARGGVGSNLRDGESPAAPIPMIDSSVDHPAAILFSYYLALGRQQWGDARTFLAPELRAELTESALADSMAGTESVMAYVMTPQSETAERSRFEATISAQTTPGAASAWNNGLENTRYVELVRMPDGWRITRISISPIPDGD